MPSPFRQFIAASPIGPGRGAPRRGARRQIFDILSLAGDAPAAGGGFDGPERIFSAIRKFQGGLNLKPDGIVKPGGPTESALNAFAVANAKGGPRLAKAIKPAFADLTKRGLTFTPDPRNPEALGMWRDANGRRVDPERAGDLLRNIGPGASDLDGKQQLFAQRMFGKAGSAKLMNAGAAPAAASGESEAAVPDGGGGQGSADSATGADNLEPKDRPTIGGSGFFPSLGIDMSAGSAGNSPPLPQPPENDGVPNVTPEAVGVPDEWKDLHRDRTGGRTHKEMFGELRDASGKVIRSGLPADLFEQQNGSELTSVFNRIAVVDKFSSTSVRDLKRDIAAIPSLTSRDRRELYRNIGIMRGSVPSDGRRERVLSDKELVALEASRENQAKWLGRGALIPPLSVPLTVLNIGADRHRRLSTAEREARRRARKNDHR